jgi:hypothetical protein
MLPAHILGPAIVLPSVPPFIIDKNRIMTAKPIFPKPGKGTQNSDSTKKGRRKKAKGNHDLQSGHKPREFMDVGSVGTFVDERAVS